MPCERGICIDICDGHGSSTTMPHFGVLRVFATMTNDNSINLYQDVFISGC